MGSWGGCALGAWVRADLREPHLSSGQGEVEEPACDHGRGWGCLCAGSMVVVSKHRGCHERGYGVVGGSHGVILFIGQPDSQVELHRPKALS